MNLNGETAVCFTAMVKSCAGFQSEFIRCCFASTAWAVKSGLRTTLDVLPMRSGSHSRVAKDRGALLDERRHALLLVCQGKAAPEFPLLESYALYVGMA